MELVYAASTAVAVAIAIGVLGLLAYEYGPRHPRLGRRGVDWATSFGISVVLSFVTGLILTAINLGFTSAFPAAFLSSFSIGVLVSTPTAYVVVPRVRALVARAAAPH